MANKNTNKTSTYGSIENNKTETYGNDTNQKTGSYSAKHDETYAYSNIQGRDFKSKTHGIGVGDRLTLKGKEYLITEIISEGTGEATIFKIEDSTKNRYALKLYFEFSNHKEEPNNDTLHRIKDITDPDILKLHDFGIGVDKYLDKHCFEISDFAEGGNLFSVKNFKEKYKPEFIEKHVVKEIYLGIKKLHENKIYHCDLKPQNVFYLDKSQNDLVIGDYGSAKAYDLETEKELRKSSTVKGTDAYLPPEQARGIISEKNDYYALGMILLHMLYPEQLTKEGNIQQVDKTKFEKIVERQYNSQPVVDFNPAYKRLNNLIEGLTLINHINRFGRVEVEKWLNVEEVDVKYRSIETSSIQPIKLGYATIKTEKDFIQVLETRNTWWEELFEDVDTYFALKAWIGNYKDIQSRKIFDEMIHFYKPLGKEFVKEAAIRYFDFDKPIQVDMKVYNFAKTNNLLEDVTSLVSQIDEIYNITGIEKLRFYLFQLEFSLKQIHQKLDGNSKVLVSSLIEKILNSFNIVPNPFESFKTQIQEKFNPADEISSLKRLIGLFYQFKHGREFKDIKSRHYKTIEDIGLSFAREEELFENKHCKAELEVFTKNKKINGINLQTYNDFLFSVFHDEISSHVQIEDIKFSERQVLIHYTLNKSLTNFFNDKGLQKSFVIAGDNHEVELRSKLLPKASRIYSTFISHILKSHHLPEDSIEKDSLTKAKTAINNQTKTYRKKQNKNATILSTGLIVYSLPIVISIIGAVILYFTPPEIQIFLERNVNASSTMSLRSAVLISLIYLAICISIIPAIIFYSSASDSRNLHSNFINGEYLYPHKFLWGILTYALISVIVSFLLGIVLYIVIGIGSFFGDYKTDPTVDAIIDFLFRLSAIVVFIGAFRPFLKFNEKASQATPIVKKYVAKKISVFIFILLSSLALVIYSLKPYSLQILPQKEQPVNIQKTKFNYIVTTAVANIRSGPSTDYPVIGQLKQNDKVELVGENKDWTIIKYNGQEAYIYSSLIAKID